VGQAQLRLRQWNRALANFETNLALMVKYDKRAWALRALVDICALHMAKGNASAIRPVAQEASAPGGNRAPGAESKPAPTSAALHDSGRGGAGDG
jgi:hypothetical protein